MNWVCLMTIFNFSCVFLRKRINISDTLVSESYVLLLFINKICLNQHCNIYFFCLLEVMTNTFFKELHV